MSSFIFLRFFAPAILSPNLFQLTPHHTVSDPMNWKTPFPGLQARARRPCWRREGGRAVKPFTHKEG